MRFLYAIVVAMVMAGAESGAQELLKTGSVLYPPETIAAVQANIATDTWAASVRERVVEGAAFWRDMDDLELWKLQFGSELPRSWMVWSNGHSPVTGDPVPMYNWKHDAKNHPWKVQDPSSGEWFPKNDFQAYYESGLDARRVFHPESADASLLFNTEHPDPTDPLHLFGVDDGHGYVNEKGERWRFINTYLIYGQWKQLIIAGVRTLSAAYVVTGDAVYARKAGILLDRAADFYPDFDFGAQGVLYEGPGASGYVSTWHDACEETRELIMSYDMIFDVIKDDPSLIEFLSARAVDAGLENPKASFADIQRNIEGRILRDALANPKKIHSNYPRAEILKAITVAVLQEPDDVFWSYVDPMMEKTTAVDGVTGEKGLAGYASFTISALASFFADFSRSDPNFLPTMIKRFPKLAQTYRFHIDTYCLGRYYPLIGDTGHYAGPMNRYVAVEFSKPGVNLSSFGNWTLLNPSIYRFMWELYEATGDVAYVQILYTANGGTSEGLPFDIYNSDGEAFRARVDEVIAREGPSPNLGSVNKQEWHLAILRSGENENRRALWLDYDTGGAHSHHDGMNLGLFAHGLDVMPDFGYPPVQYGGWKSDRAQWYTKTAAHNTVMVDGKDHATDAGVTTLWHDGPVVRAIRAAGAGMAEVERFERTSLTVDIDESAFYVVDVIRVRGGQTHTKFQQSHFGELILTGTDPAEADIFPTIDQMRNVAIDPAPSHGWTADWLFEDAYKLTTDGLARGLHYVDLSRDMAAGTAEAWIVTGMYGVNSEQWIPRLVVQGEAQDDSPLESTFVAVFEPWKERRSLKSAKRLADGPWASNTEVAIEVTLQNGHRDTLILRDAEAMSALPAVAAGAVETDGQLGFVRRDTDGKVIHSAQALGTRIEIKK